MTDVKIVDARRSRSFAKPMSSFKASDEGDRNKVQKKYRREDAEEKPLRDGKDPDKKKKMPRDHRTRGERPPGEPRQDAAKHHKKIAHYGALEAVLDKAEGEMSKNFSRPDDRRDTKRRQTVKRKR